MFDIKFYQLILKSHHIFFNKDLKFFIFIREPLINIFIKNQIKSHIEYESSILKVSISNSFFNNYISSILSYYYNNIDLDIICYIISKIRIWSNLKLYPIHIDIESYKPVKGWCKELYTRDICHYIDKKNSKKYLKFLESCLVILYDYDKLDYKEILTSPLYILLNEKNI